jgi:hypothetical protein
VKYRVLSLKQPWATLVSIGAKRLETRSWETKYRGPLLIHASKAFPYECRELCFETLFLAALGNAGVLPKADEGFQDCLPLGSIIARVQLVDCFQIRMSNRPGGAEFAFGDYTPGRFAWKLDNVEPLEPIPAKGSLGIWTFEYDGNLVRKGVGK